jgi:ferredoxin
MKIVVNWLLCDGNGNCAKVAPELFVMGDDDTLKILKETVDETGREKALAAVRACPKSALALSESVLPET